VTGETAFALMPHQCEAVEFLLAKGSGLLALEQGLGKTLVAIAAFQQLHRHGQVSCMVVICPNSLKGNWVAEVRRFAPELRIHVFSGPAPQRRIDLRSTAADVYIVNYETARNEITSLRALLQRRASVLVLDESHNVKNLRSLNATAARHLAPLVRYRWLLTGTPVTNSPADIYPQLGIVADPNPLGSLGGFMARFGAAAESVELRAGLAGAIAPYLLRRTKDECLDLPEKTFVDLRIDLPAWQRNLYDEMRDRFICEVETMDREQFRCFAPTALSQLLRLSQLASNPRLIFPSETRVPGKQVELDALIEELVVGGGRKVIIWSYYVKTIEELMARYSHLGAVAIYGAVPAAERQQIVERFQSDDCVRVFIGNPAAAGTGLTLTAATYSIYETVTWRYDLYAQSQDRNHRIGQHERVVYVRLTAVDTVEEAIIQALARKGVLARELVGDAGTGSAIADMGPEAFCELLKTGALPEHLDRDRGGTS
jgi:SNF2 family DNA or RNA helicase